MGALNHDLGLLFDVLFLLLARFEQGLCIITKLPGFVEILPDSISAAVEHAGHLARNLQPDEQTDKQKKRDRDDEIGVVSG